MSSNMDDYINDDEMDMCTIERMNETTYPRVIEPVDDYELYNFYLNRNLKSLWYRLDNEFRCRDELMIITSSSALDHLKYKHEVDMFRVHAIIEAHINSLFSSCVQTFARNYSVTQRQEMYEQICRDINNEVRPMIDEYIRLQHV